MGKKTRFVGNVSAIYIYTIFCAQSKKCDGCTKSVGKESGETFHINPAAKSPKTVFYPQSGGLRVII